MSAGRDIHLVMTHSAAGGLRELWDDLAEGLAARGHRVRRWVLYPPADAGEAPPGDAWRPIVPARPRSPLAAARALAAVVRLLRCERPAAVLTAMPAANVVLPLAAALARVPVRVVLSHHAPADGYHPLLRRLDGWTGCLPCVAGVVSVSDTVAASLSGRPAAYRAKRVTIPNALPERIERMLAAMPRRPRAAAGAPARIVALGRLTRQKNYPLLLRALAEVPDARLEIVGGGEDAAALRALADTLGIADRVRFAGALPRGAALERAALADIFVQASLYEGHSLALLEAARLGLPLVVSDVPVQVEGITARDGTRCGIAVPLGDPGALAAALAGLARDPAARAHWSALSARLAAEASGTALIDRYEATLAPAAVRR